MIIRRPFPGTLTKCVRGFLENNTFPEEEVIHNSFTASPSSTYLNYLGKVDGELIELTIEYLTKYSLG